MRPLELWVGPEPTVNRVAHRYFDQLQRTGFAWREDDIDRLASLRPACVRFPLLWERTERAPADYDFRWADGRLARLRAHGIRPILGLLHHGSGPRHTSLQDPDFPQRLAHFAAAVARRYPWVDAWTPINEPLTTARFAGLYGLWYPHGKDERVFVRVLLQQLNGIAAAMRAVREVQPGARLVQTEDLGFTHATPSLRHQADFDNERRWLGLDTLLGRLDRSHTMWRHLVDHGIGPAELEGFVEQPVVIDTIGLNVYVTSERYLDHRTERHDPRRVGGNGRERYADVEAVRVPDLAFGGFEPRLAEAATRYGLPLAVTEAHLQCTREEQMRWLLEAWHAAQALRARQVNVQAVTAWSAFGAFDWSTLLTRSHNHYESGLWDIRSNPPRRTALAGLAAELASGQAPAHPVLHTPGWWRREIRSVALKGGTDADRHPAASDGAPPLLITGGRGTLAQALSRLCRLRGLPHLLLARDRLDITQPASITEQLALHKPWAVVNAAGYVRVDDAERDARQWADNAIGPVLLARACRDHGIRLLTFSSDLVFDGRTNRPHIETDAVHPLNAYGRAKAHAEDALADAPHVLTVRTAAFFGPWDRHNFVSAGLAALTAGAHWPAFADQVVSPTYVPELVNTCLDLLIDGESGVWHVANQGAVSWYELACRVAEARRLPTRLVKQVPRPWGSAPRPPYSALGSCRGRLTSDLDTALTRYLEAVGPMASPAPIDTAGVATTA